MDLRLLTIEMHYEHDVVLARQRARQLARLLGFDPQDQVRLATAVSEIARNAFQYARHGKIEFFFQEGQQPQVLRCRISDKGNGIANLKQILDGQYRSSTGMGLGMTGAKRLMDSFDIQTDPAKGTVVSFGKTLPQRAEPVTSERIAAVMEAMGRQEPGDPFSELQQQNQELLAALEELQKRQNQLAQLNTELEDTNRGVVALYAELDERADYLRRASDLKTRFLSNMTHEFRTPLNSMLSLSQMLLERTDGELSPEQEKQVQFIRTAAVNLSELVNDLLDLAKVEAGKVSIRPAPFEMADLFGALRGMLRPLLAHNSSVSLVFKEPKEIPTLNTDESKVSQILRNFISNALKYTERGEVRVSASLGAPGMVTISVSDTGIGIAPEDHARIFEEFTQLDNAYQAKAKGTGLGLPLSKKLAELLGGFVTVDSLPGRGSTFSVTVPIACQSAEEMAFVPEISRELDPTRLPVLVVDDNSEAVFVYAKYLKETEFQVLPAKNLAQARQALAEFRPAAVILDILLQNENTWPFLAELKANSATRDIPVLVITMVDNARKALSLGADGFHVKPVSRAWLTKRLRQLTQLSAPREILLIDADQVSRYMLKGLLKDTCWTIHEASSGHEGWRQAQDHKPAVIFLDIDLPDLNGFDLLDRLKSDPGTSAIPVIIQTGKKLTDQEREHLAGRSVSILQKGISSSVAAMSQVREALKSAGLSQPEPRKELHHV
jgi:signal transduction histidine kinase/CheY-like chemotaxis protein